MSQDALIDTQLNPFATDGQSIHYLNQLLTKYRFVSVFKSKQTFCLSETLHVCLTHSLVVKRLMDGLADRCYFVLSNKAEEESDSVHTLDILGVIRYEQAQHRFLTGTLPKGLGDWSVKSFQLSSICMNNMDAWMEAIERESILIKNHFRFHHVDILGVERSRYIVLKKQKNKTLSFVLKADEDKTCELNLGQRFQLCLHLIQTLKNIHEEGNVLCNLSPDNIHIDLGSWPISLWFSDFGGCAPKRALRSFKGASRFGAPEWFRSQEPIPVNVMMDMFSLGRVFWLIWGNDRFNEATIEEDNNFVSMTGLKDRHRSRLTNLLLDMCKLYPSERPTFEILEREFKLMVAHYTAKPFKRFKAPDLNVLTPVQFFTPTLSQTAFNLLLNKSIARVENLIKTRLSAKCRNQLLQLTSLFDLVKFSMENHQQSELFFPPSHLMCQFMKVAANEGELDSVCAELMIDLINPNLLILDSAAKHSYITYSAGLFHNFAAANKERHDFFQSLTDYLAMHQEKRDELTF